MSERWSFAELDAALLGRIETLVAALPLPEPMPGHRSRSQLRFGAKGALVIWLDGARAGRWRDFSDDAAHGDLIDLIAWARGCALREALRWSCDWLGLPKSDRPRREAIDEAAQHRATERRQQEAARRATAVEHGRLLARRLWVRRRAAWGSPVQTYLRGRGLLLPPHCPWIGYVPDLEYWEAPGGGAPAVVTGHHPAMVAAIQGADGRLIGVHRTYLRCWPDGRVTKAHLPAPKKVVGTWAGGAIRLTQPAAEDGTLALAEGIETGLAVWHAHHAAGQALTVWAVVAVANFGQVALPPAVRRVVLCGDGDEAGLVQRIVDDRIEARPATAAGRTLARAVGHWRRNGIEVHLAIPGGRKRDWNDVLQGAA